MRPQSVHVLLGFNRGEYGFHSVAAEVRLGAGYDPERPGESLASDFALLRLVERAPAIFTPLKIADDALQDRSAVSAGFAQQRSQVLTATKPCRVTGRTSSGLIVTDCVVSRGLSGGPLIDEASGELIGIQVAGGERDSRPFALAIPMSRVRGMLSAF